MGYFPVRYDSRVVIYERKMFIRLATDYSTSHPDLLGLVTSCFRSKTAFWGPVCCCLWWGSMTIGDFVQIGRLYKRKVQMTLDLVLYNCNRYIAPFLSSLLWSCPTTPTNCCIKVSMIDVGIWITNPLGQIWQKLSTKLGKCDNLLPFGIKNCHDVQQKEVASLYGSKVN